MSRPPRVLELCKKAELDDAASKFKAEKQVILEERTKLKLQLQRADEKGPEIPENQTSPDLGFYLRAPRGIETSIRVFPGVVGGV